MFNKEVSYKNAVKILRFSSIFKEFMLFFPIMILVFLEKGITVGDFFLIQGSYFFFIFLLEIPTGYIGDLFSRKKVLLMASFMMIVAYVILYFASGFWSLILLELAWAISMSLDSGTKDAYLYDVLKKDNREKHSIKEFGKLRSLIALGIGLATFIGGYVYSLVGLSNIILIQTSFVSISFILLMFLPDLKDVKRVVTKGKSKFEDVLSIVKYATTHQEIKWIILYSSVFFAAILILMWGMQPLMEHGLVPLALFGVFVGINQIIRACFSKYASKILHMYKIKKMCYLLGLFLMLGFISSFIILQLSNIYLIYALLIFVSIGVATIGCMEVVMTSLINHRIKSDERATVLSVNSMARGLFAGIGLTLCKFIIDGYSLQAMYLILTPIILIVIFISMKKLLKLELK